MNNLHTFHIPVMGTGFTIDTPIKVAHYGISSVISLVDDLLIEQMRRYYCGLFQKEYTEITKYDEDYRARRITAYLNLVDEIVKKKFEKVRSSSFEVKSEITKYFELLPDTSPLKILYNTMLKITDIKLKEKAQNELRTQMRPGDIEVNIMTKLDRMNLAQDKTELPEEFSDALSSLRGFAQSSLNSAIVFSAGINRRLYSYIEKFEDFYANAVGDIKKRIILKVSDYRSSLTQGKFLAKKGLWVSEYRVESGLNCGGHAFATDGFLMGPILEEFKTKKEELIQSVQAAFQKAVQALNKNCPESVLPVRLTAQGGIGTTKEDQFLLSHYQFDGTGWATPFLLVPEASNVDQKTLSKLSDADESDLYLSNSSPLGVPFNNLKNSLSDQERLERIKKNRPGSPCPKGHLVSTTEFTKQLICTASRQYQKLKIEQLNELNLNEQTYQEHLQQITDKACICHDLAASPLIEHNLGRTGEKLVTAICPGPNLAYFSKIATLKEMVDHIYGRLNLLNKTPRPHMFIKELTMYVEYLTHKVKKEALEPTEKQIKYFSTFMTNLFEGIEYYKDLFAKNMKQESEECRQKALEELKKFKTKLEEFSNLHEKTFSLIAKIFS
ncbi:591aa hypothetical protein: FIG00906767 [hydrothermal vent metagenome]|uniref:Uncharacterized protein n=1 Tax=hydrothermal vent metagenome TaxID=652676 RepID=A0A3B1D4J8_9ZZZZ